MSVRLFRGDGIARTEPVQLPMSRRQSFLKEENYRADEHLINAVNVALMLGQPLLLTGEPGTGKSQLAYYVAWELGLNPLLKFETKSDSTAESLFYTYDALKRFQHAQSNVKTDSALPYITYNALGKAILLSRDPDDVKGYLGDDFDHPGPSRSVVLIDEIDKAPRDFPNDILNELDSLYFRVPELDNRQISANRELLPVVILTSNSEKDLPDAFLRRCVFYNIPFPDSKEMKKIVEGRLGLVAGGSSEFLDTSLELFYALRKSLKRKKPSTSELLEWITAMLEMTGNVENPLAERPQVALEAISTLGKAVEDQPEARSTVQAWIDAKTS
jgi:MoxR-like ATPase